MALLHFLGYVSLVSETPSVLSNMQVSVSMQVSTLIWYQVAVSHQAWCFHSGMYFKF